MKQLVCIFLVLSLVSCASRVKLTTTFNPENLEWVKKKGKYRVSGESFAMTIGGTPKTCAGKWVYLIPVSDYSSEIMMKAYKSTEMGKRTDKGYVIENIDPQFDEYTLKAQCSSTGQFSFKNVPKGEYFLESKFQWYVGGQYSTFQNVAVMRKVKVEKSIKDIKLTL